MKRRMHEIKGDRKVKARIIHQDKELGFYPRVHGKPQNFLSDKKDIKF